MTPVFDFTLALRNLIRYRTRSLIALAAISFGITALILASGFMEWLFWGFREGMIHSRLSHIQVTRPGYAESGRSDPFSYLLVAQSPEPQALLDDPEIKAVAPKLDFTGLIAFNDTTVSFIGEATDIAKEKGAAESLQFTSGSALPSNDVREIVVGKGLGEFLGLKLGDKVVLLANTTSGGVNAVEVHVRGFFTTDAKAYDDLAIRAPLPLAQELLRIKGAHTWMVYLKKTESTDRVLKELRGRYQKANLEFTGWNQLADFYNKTVDLFSKQLNVVRSVIAVIIILSISNTLIMSVLERTGEIGTLMALGQKRRDILRLFLSEGLLLGIIGGLLGLTLGIVLAKIISAIGIPMPAPPGMSAGFIAGIMVTSKIALEALALAIITTLLASAYPAYRASQLIIVDALRHNR